MSVPWRARLPKARDVPGAIATPALRDAMDEAVRKRGAPFLGICVGMQLLLAEGHEHGVHPGLGWIPGLCRRHDAQVRLPHMGWNAVAPTRPHPVLDGLSPSRHMVFMHSFVVVPEDNASVAAVTDYGAPFASAVAQDNLVGVQFHPEKSQAAGLDLLSRFLAWSPT
jgi:glutamine amidotransferase